MQHCVDKGIKKEDAHWPKLNRMLPHLTSLKKKSSTEKLFLEETFNSFLKKNIIIIIIIFIKAKKIIILWKTLRRQNLASTEKTKHNKQRKMFMETNFHVTDKFYFVQREYTGCSVYCMWVK